MYLALGYVLEFLGYHLLPDRGDKVGKNDPVKMRKLVLNHSGREFVESLLDLGEVLVVILDGDFRWPDNISIDARYAETAF